VTQVPRGNRPGVTLPVRIHELLLTFAGRLDDDALGDARGMLASAELDRSLEYVAGCLAAGGVVLDKAQQRDLESLFAETYLDPSLLERVVARDPAPAIRHRFAIGPFDGREPERGIADAIRPVLGALPDVRSVWCVWRLTPAGPASGPVPHRVVLVGVGPGGFPPATAYRVEYALRRAGIRASVEVLVDGTEPGGYHQEAMRCAQQVPFGDAGPGAGPPMGSVDPAHAQFGGERYDRPGEPMRPVEPPRPMEPPRVVEPRPEPAPVEPPRIEPPRMVEAPRAEPAPVEPPRIEPPRAIGPAVEPPTGFGDGSPLPPPIELPQAVPALPPPVELRPVPEPVDHASQENSTLPTPPHGNLAPVPLHRAEQSGPVPPAVEFRRPQGQEPPPRAVTEPGPPPESPRAEADPDRSGPHQVPNAMPSQLPSPVPTAGPAESTAVFAPAAPMPDEQADDAELPDSALHIQTPTNSRPSPRRRKTIGGTRPRLVPASDEAGAAEPGDDILNTQERNLLRELQDELARREQEEQGSTTSAGWSGRHGFDSARVTGGPAAINGMPPTPEGRGYPPLT
jgi:hypothetical protein